uniref:Putative secreted protein n=1 Tax=Ixodes ricinus TaxID=34613 RepID=A0A6B0URE1_IXORI
MSSFLLRVRAVLFTWTRVPAWPPRIQVTFSFPFPSFIPPVPQLRDCLSFVCRRVFLSVLLCWMRVARAQRLPAPPSFHAPVCSVRRRRAPRQAGTAFQGRACPHAPTEPLSLFWFYFVFGRRARDGLSDLVH